MIALLLAASYLFGVLATGGALLGWTAEVVGWMFGASPLVVVLVGAMALAFAATLAYPRSRQVVHLTRVAWHADADTTPEVGSPLGDYLAELAADRWRDHHGAADEPVAEVLDLGEARRARRAA